MDIERSKATFTQVKSRWNKKLDALGCPRIGRGVKALPKTFQEYLAQSKVNNEAIKPQDIDYEATWEQQAAQCETTGRNIDGDLSMEMIDKNIGFVALQQMQGQIIINKLTAIEHRLDALESACRPRDVDFDEQFEKINKNLAALRSAVPARAPTPTGTPIGSDTAVYQGVEPTEAGQPTPAEQRRAAPPDATDHRGESLPDWVIQDLSYDFEISAIKNMFERFKQYYYENAYILPDYNGVKIKLRQWLERAAENGEQVMSRRALIEIENQRQQQIRAENTRRYEAEQARARMLNRPDVRQAAESAFSDILTDLRIKNE